MNVLVTGATGVIGHQAVPRLLQAGHDVAGVAHCDPGAGCGQSAPSRSRLTCSTRPWSGRP
jgi:nucleoside-diphosphate-sugar epimerase